MSIVSEVRLLFLGSGTSAGVPMIGCRCAVCTSSDPHDKRTRPSVVISYGTSRVLVDTTPELRLQCVANGVDRVDAVVYTHAHADHIMGLDDVRRFNSILNAPMDVYADGPTFETLQRCFAYAFRPPEPNLAVFRPHLVHRLISGAFHIHDVLWTPIRLMHGQQEVLGFRVGRLAYCTDVSAIPEESYDLLHDLDVLVLDGLHFKKHPTHFNIEEAVAAAKRIGARTTYLTHLSHGVPHAQTNASLPAGIQLAYDGLEVAARLG